MAGHSFNGTWRVAPTFRGQRSTESSSDLD